MRREEIGKQQTQLGYGAIIDALRFFPTGHLAVRALDIALRIMHPVYDCLYLALAESMDLMILTADHKLILACEHTDFAGLLISLDDAARLPQ